MPTAQAVESRWETHANQACFIPGRDLEKVREPLFKLIGWACDYGDVESMSAFVSKLKGERVDPKLSLHHWDARSASAGMDSHRTQEAVRYLFDRLPTASELMTEFIFKVRALLRSARISMMFGEDGRFVTMPAYFNQPFSARYGLSPLIPEINPDVWAPREVRAGFGDRTYAGYLMDPDVYGDAFEAGLLEYGKSYLSGPTWDETGAVSVTPWYRIYDGMERVYWAWSTNWIPSCEVEHYFNRILNDNHVPLIMIDGRVQPVREEDTPFRLASEPIEHWFRSGVG